MMLKLKKLNLILVVAVLVWGVREAKADQYYPFIKVDCNKAAQTFTISMPYLQKGDDPEQMLADIRAEKTKNMYYLIDIAKEPKKKVACDLDNEQKISFIGYFNGNRMADDNLEFTFDGHGTGRFWTSTDDKILIKVLGPDEVTTRACKLQRRDNTVREDTCKVRHFKNGKEITE